MMDRYYTDSPTNDAVRLFFRKSVVHHFGNSCPPPARPELANPGRPPDLPVRREQDEAPEPAEGGTDFQSGVVKGITQIRGRARQEALLFTFKLRIKK
jgi:hypothetical protein